jgi:membrane-associated phospholipid phosphatase
VETTDGCSFIGVHQLGAPDCAPSGRRYETAILTASSDEVLTTGTWQDMWFPPVGNSFPSGHAVHFWSLFFPLVVLFPRYWKQLAVLPVLVSLARVVVNDHYFSDVVASAAVAALVTWAYAKTILARGRAVHTSLNENN